MITYTIFILLFFYSQLHTKLKMGYKFTLINTEKVGCSELCINDEAHVPE